MHTIAALLIASLLAACNSTQRPPTREELDDAEKPDEWRERGAQSDFLDIGKQAGIEWLSFVQNDQREYPEYFEGLDRDQKRRLRLAPKEDATNRVLLEFNLPKGSKLWPVDWYGTELMAIDLPNAAGISLAVARDTGPTDGAIRKVAEARVSHPLKEDGRFDDGSGGTRSVSESNGIAVLSVPPNGGTRGAYGYRLLKGRTTSLRVYVEVGNVQDPGKVAGTVLDSISIKRELALEGSPKHKCSSSMDELLRGTLHFPGGTLNLPLTDGYLARKIGGDSTVQIDGEGASPWLLLRRLEPSSAPGGLKQQVRADTTFKRRRDVSSARFEAGRLLKGTLPLVVFDYRETGAEQQVLGLIAFGTELFTIEINSKGVIDGESRREARDKALALLQSATGTGTDRSLQQLEGWKPSE